MLGRRLAAISAALVVVVSPLLTACSKEQSVTVPRPEKGEIMKIDSQQGRALLESDRRVVLFDVRTVREYMKGHVVGAQIAELSDPGRWEFRIAEFDRDQPVMVYCRDEECSHEAAQKLVDDGFTEVYDLGDPSMWDSKYLPIDKRGKAGGSG